MHHSNRLVAALAVAGAACAGIGVTSSAGAVPTTHVQVRVVSGNEALSAGSQLELRIYEVGHAMRRYPLTHGEAWPRATTRMIPLDLPEPLEPRNVQRFALYYRASSPLTPPWEVVAAEVELAGGGGGGGDGAEPQLLLNETLFGVIDRQGEIATAERDAGALMCVTDADCDDHLSCNGQERCAPRTQGADARGCVKGTPRACPVNQVCTEQRGCRGADPAPAPATAAQ